MKKIYNILMLAVVAAAALVGCTNTDNTLDETPTQNPSNGVYRQLTFTTANESRTHHNGETIVWSDGDRIRICYTKDGVWQNAEGRAMGDAATPKLYASTEQNGNSEHSIFRITQYFYDTGAGEHIFYGLHPSAITKGNKPDFTEDGVVPILLPSIQNPSATSFDGCADLLVSRSADSYDSFPTYEEQISMAWTRLVTHGMITLKNLTAAGMVEGETIKYVEFAADEDVALTGEFALDIAGQALTATNAKNKVRLSYADNTEYNTLVDADTDGVADDFVVWFATAPFTTTDLTVTIGTNKATYTRTFTGANKTFVVNKRNLLGVNMSQATRTPFEMVEVYELLTDASLLAVGKKVVIAAADADMAMSTSQGSNYRTAVAATKNGKNITINDDTQILEIKEGTKDGTWAFYTGSNYLVSTTNNGQLKTSSLTLYGSWSVDITDDGIATLLASTGTYKKMRYYASGTTYAFRCYSTTATSASYHDISLYHNVESSESQLKQMVAPVIESATELEGNTVNVVWTHDTTDITGEVYYTIECTQGENNVVFDSITETEFIADNLADGVWSITVTAHADGYNPATSEAVEVEVIGMTPTIYIEPSELHFAGNGGSQQVEISVKNLGSNLTFTAESDSDVFTTSFNKQTLTVTAKKNDSDTGRSGKITVTVSGSVATVQTDILVSQDAGAVIYRKITSMLKDFSGQYLIVNEAENTAFNGSLTTLNANNNYTSITISGNEIAVPVTSNNFYFTIEKSGANYILKTASGRYIGKTDNADGLNSSTSTKYTNSILFNGTDMDIVGQAGAYLRFNESSNKFSYFSTGNYANYSTIQLYRLEGTGSNETLTRLATPVVITSVDGATINVSWEAVANAENYKVTCGDESQTVTGTSVSFSGLQYSTEYTVSVVANAAADGDYYDSAAATATVTTGENPNAGQGVIDVIDLAFTGVAATTTSASYANWENTSSISQVVYSGRSAGAYSSITLTTPTSSQYYGIVTKTSAGKATMVVVRWNSATASGRTLDIYGKNEAYTSTNLYSSTTRGTKLGSIVCGTSTAFVIDGNYEYIGLRSSSSAMYIDEIQIVWNYTPLAAPTVTATVEGNTATVSWNEVAGAANYTVTCGEQTQTITGTSATFAGLPYWSTHEVSVVANPTADSTTHCFSPTATASVEIGANPTKREYQLVFLPTDFPTANTSKTFTMVATATDGSGDTINVLCGINYMWNNGGIIYWQQSGSLLYNATGSDLGSITSVAIDSTSTKLTTTIGASQKPSTAVEGGGYFQIKASGSTNANRVTVTFEK